MSRKPTRDQLARFLPTTELVRAFESLFDLSAGDTGAVEALRAAITALTVRTDGLQLAQNDNDVSDAVDAARVSAVVAALDELTKAVDGLAMAPPVIPSSAAVPVAPGSANSVIVSCNFGASFAFKAQTVVTGLTWVTGTTSLSAQVLTPSGVDPDEMLLLHMAPVISDIVPGDGFTVTVYSVPEARGTYDVMIVGV